MMFVAAVNCDEALLLNTLALAGTAPPLTLPTIVALCVPVTSPPKLPVKLVALLALVAFATAVDPIALTICAPVATTGADPVEK
jgi:hypothetical protein